MGSKSGGGGGMQTTTSQQFTTPNPMAMQAYRNLLSRAQELSNQPYVPYTGELVAGFSPLQEQAFKQIQGLQGMSQPYFNTAADFARNAVGSLSPENYGKTIGQYQSPYTQDVVNATMARLGQQNQQQQSQLLGNAAKSGAAFGDRLGVAQANLAGQQSLASAQTISDLYNRAFQNAQGAAERAAGLGLSGAGVMGGLGGQALQSALSETGALSGAGATQQRLDQARLASAYEQWRQQQAFPYSQLGWLAGIAQGVGPQMGSTTYGTQTQPSQQPSSLSQGVGAGIAGLGALSQLPWESIMGGIAPFLALADGGRVSMADGGDISDSDRDLMIRTLAGEAGAEPDLGKAAVAHVIMNRLASGQWGNSLGDVIRAPRQFSVWNPGDPAGDIARGLSAESPQYSSLGDIVDAVRAGSIKDPTGGALNYYNPAVARPAWGPQLAKTGDVTIGGHRFVGGTGAIDGAGRPALGFAEAPVTQQPASAGLGAIEKAVGSRTPQSGFLSPELGQGLIAAGLGMMAAPTRNVGRAIGEGGLAGLQAYQQVSRDKRYDQRLAEQAAHQRAQEDQARAVLAETARWHREREADIQRRMTDRPPIALGEGQILVDPQTGRQIAAGRQKNDLERMNAQREGEADRLGLKGDDRLQYITSGKIPTQTEKQTQDQSNAAIFATRMAEANKILSDPVIYGSGVGAAGAARDIAQAVPVLGNFAIGSTPGGAQYQQYDQAKRDFVNAILRKESGAAITQSEFNNAEKQYFPRPGDTPEVIEQKAKNRTTAMEAIARAGSLSFRKEFAEKVNPYQSSAVIGEARDAIARGASRDAVIRRLKEHGIDATGL